MSNRLKRRIMIAAAIAVAACSQQPQPPVQASRAPVPTPDENESLGVPDCDDYLNKYQACVAANAPESARASLIQSLNQTRSAWRNALSNSASRDTLARACRQAHAIARPSLAAYGCTDF